MNLFNIIKKIHCHKQPKKLKITLKVIYDWLDIIGWSTESKDLRFESLKILSTFFTHVHRTIIKQGKIESM